MPPKKAHRTEGHITPIIVSTSDCAPKTELDQAFQCSYRSRGATPCTHTYTDSTLPVENNDIISDYLTVLNYNPQGLSINSPLYLGYTIVPPQNTGSNYYRQVISGVHDASRNCLIGSVPTITLSTLTNLLLEYLPPSVIILATPIPGMGDNLDPTYSVGSISDKMTLTFDPEATYDWEQYNYLMYTVLNQPSARAGYNTPSIESYIYSAIKDSCKKSAALQTGTAATTFLRPLFTAYAAAYLTSYMTCRRTSLETVQICNNNIAETVQQFQTDVGTSILMSDLSSQSKGADTIVSTVLAVLRDPTQATTFYRATLRNLLPHILCNIPEKLFTQYLQGFLSTYSATTKRVIMHAAEPDNKDYGSCFIGYSTRVMATMVNIYNPITPWRDEDPGGIAPPQPRAYAYTLIHEATHGLTALQDLRYDNYYHPNPSTREIKTAKVYGARGCICRTLQSPPKYNTGRSIQQTIAADCVMLAIQALYISIKYKHETNYDTYTVANDNGIAVTCDPNPTGPLAMSQSILSKITTVCYSTPSPDIHITITHTNTNTYPILLSRESAMTNSHSEAITMIHPFRQICTTQTSHNAPSDQGIIALAPNETYTVLVVMSQACPDMFLNGPLIIIEVIDDLRLLPTSDAAYTVFTWGANATCSFPEAESSELLLGLVGS